MAFVRRKVKMPRCTNSEKRFAMFFLTLAAFLPASQTGAAPRVKGKRPSTPSVREVLGWLPANTETIAVARGPFKVKAFAGTQADTGNESLKEVLEQHSLGPLGIINGACEKKLRGQR